MALSVEHRKYLVRDQMVVPFFINFVLNAMLPWLAFRSQQTVSIWGNPGVVGDMVVTMFALPAMICLIATPLVRLMARAGKAPALPSLADVPGLAPRLPANLWLRALLLGAVVCLLASPMILGALQLSGWAEISVLNFALGKGAICGLLAALISPPLAIRALAEGTQATTTAA